MFSGSVKPDFTLDTVYFLVYLQWSNGFGSILCRFPEWRCFVQSRAFLSRV